MDIFLDFETRSLASLQKPNDVGAAKYAEHPSTLPLMLAYGVRPKQKIWRLSDEYIKAFGKDGTYIKQVFEFDGSFGPPECPDDLINLINQPDKYSFHAMNAAFEIYIWHYVCHLRWGWPEIPLTRWHCTMAKASHANMPKGLGKLTARLQLKANKAKDASGKELIKTLSVPTKAQKTYKKARKDADGKSIKRPNEKGQMRCIYDTNVLSERYARENDLELFELPNKPDGAKFFFQYDEKKFDEFADYCKQDVVAEIQVDGILPPLPKSEDDLWRLDREINMRGIPVDLDLCHGAMRVYEVEVNHAHAAMDELTDGAVDKCTKREKLVNWLNERVRIGQSLADPIIPTFLKEYKNPATWPDIMVEGVDVSEMPKVRRALELREMAGGTAVAKYKAAINYAQDDHRCRDQVLYHGAATGRWTGKGLQPHNMKRAAILDETFIDAIKTGDHGLVEMMANIEGMDVLTVLKKCVRGVIQAPEGKTLAVSDFAGIEARVLHWLVGNETMVELFRQKQDIYIHAALDIYGCDPSDIADWNGMKWKIQKGHEEKRQVGKVAQLGLGYGMGWTTFQSNAEDQGIVMSDEFAQDVVTKWREANKEVPTFWYAIEKACKSVVYAAKGRNAKLLKLRLNGLTVWYDPRDYLCITLPSGRTLRYYSPIVSDGSLYYYDGSKFGKAENKLRVDTYGGKLCENIVQAIARDLLVNSMWIIDTEGIPLIFHVHDEVVAEIDKGDSVSYDIIHRAMSTVPDWAAGLPLEAESYTSTRYTK